MKMLPMLLLLLVVVVGWFFGFWFFGFGFFVVWGEKGKRKGRGDKKRRRPLKCFFFLRIFFLFVWGLHIKLF